MPHMTCGTLLAHLLEAHGVDRVFGIPGVHNVELYRGLWQTRIRHVSPRHEQGAGFMADGYARSSGKPGVAFVITGPGLTNIATAMGQAYADSVPMLVVSAVNKRHELGFGRGYLHEMPSQRNVAAGLTAFAHTLLRPAELPDALAAAFSVFSSSRPRPVNIEIPIDIMEEKGDWDIEAMAAKARNALTRPAPDPHVLDKVAGLLAASRRTVILAGGGAAGPGLPPGQAHPVQHLAEMLEAPVVLTTNGRGLLPPDHRLLVDFCAAYDAGRTLLDEADVVLAIGTEFGETDYEFYATSPFRLRTTLVRIDIDPRQIAIGPAVTHGIVADAGLAVERLIARLEGSAPRKHDAKWAAGFVKKGNEIAARTREPEDGLYDRLLTTVREAMGHPIVVGDSTKPAYRGQMMYRAPRPRSWSCAGTGFGTLGYALPAAIGAKIANPERPVVCLIGDGGAQFTLPELISAREAEAGIVMLVWNNEGYREIRDFMVAKEIKPIAVDPIPPSFVGIAEAMGVKGKRVESLAELGKLLKAHGGKAKAPLLLEAGPWLKG